MIENIANEIAESTCSVIGFDVIITDDKGTIIGASDKERLMSLHEASLEVVRKGKPLSQKPGYINHLKGTKPGYSIPIEMNQRVIGVIGITGEREKVEKFGLLVKKLAEMMITQEILVKSIILSEQAIKSLIQEIISFNPLKTNDAILYSKGYELGFDLRPPHIPIIIEILNFNEYMSLRHEDKEQELKRQKARLDIQQALKSVFSNSNDISSVIGEHRFIILHSIKNTDYKEKVYKNVEIKCGQLLQELRRLGFESRVCIGKLAYNLSELSLICKSICRLAEIKSMHKEQQSTLYMADYPIEILLSYLDKDISQNFVEDTLKELNKQMDHTELLKTIKAWCESGFHQTETSKRLHIHRNTLNYRIDRIASLTTLNPKSFQDALILYIAILIMEPD